MELPKVHEPIHVPCLYVQEYGSPQNWATGPLENGHIYWLKKTGQNTQKRKDKLDEQTAKRQVEQLVLRSADALVNSKVEAEERIIVPRSTRFTIDFCREEQKNGSFTTTAKFKWASAHKKDRPIRKPPQAALDYLSRLFDVSFKEVFADDPRSSFPVTIRGRTEDLVDDQLYRAHPWYRKEGPWNDWVNYRYHNQKENKVELLPAQLWMFLDLSALLYPKHVHPTQDQLDDIVSNLAGFEEPGIYAVATSFVEKPVPVRTSILLSSSRRWNEFMLLPTSAFYGPVMVVKNIGAKDTDKDALFVVKRRKDWTEEFLGSKSTKRTKHKR